MSTLVVFLLSFWVLTLIFNLVANYFQTKRLYAYLEDVIGMVDTLRRIERLFANINYEEALMKMNKEYIQDVMDSGGGEK